MLYAIGYGILGGIIGLLLGYVAGYHWKSHNPTDTRYDKLVYIGYPVSALLLALALGFLAVFLINLN